LAGWLFVMMRVYLTGIRLATTGDMPVDGLGQEREEPAHCRGDVEGGARSVQAAAGAQEEAGSESTADREHLDLPRLQALVVALVLRVKKGVSFDP
jgi:hypothetical protein